MLRCMNGQKDFNTEIKPSPHSVSTRLGNLRPLAFIRPRDTQKIAARSIINSKAVKFLRFLIPVGMTIFIIGLFVWPHFRSEEIVKTVVNNIPNLVVDNLHMTGLDQKSQPYSLDAVKAFKVATAKNMVDLEKPQGEVSLKSGAWLSGKADFGRFDQVNKKLWLGGNVQVFHDSGYEMTTSEAQLNLKENTAFGEKPVLIQGAFGEIQGQGFNVLEKGNVIVITGKATARLNLRKTPSSDTSLHDKPLNSTQSKNHYNYGSPAQPHSRSPQKSVTTSQSTNANE